MIKDNTKANKFFKKHKFFSRELDNDLDDLYSFLQKVNKMIRNEELFNIDSVTDHHMNKLPKNIFMNEKESIPSMTTEYYNIFNFKHPGLVNLLKAIKSMTIEACDYYGVNFSDQQFVINGWFNLYSVKDTTDHNIEMTKELIEKLPWHDHGSFKFPNLHGYYSVSAEPTETYYNIMGDIVKINNKNNTAILSETGYPHAMGLWNLPTDRITIAYDIRPIDLNINDPINSYHDNKIIFI